MPKNRPELTEVEWSIIKAIWENEPCTAPSIQKRLARKTGWTYSTVRTVMDRMVAKNLLSSQKLGKITWYRSRITRPEAQKSELLYALKHAFNGALKPMVQCLLDTRELSGADIEELEVFLKSKRNPKS